MIAFFIPIIVILSLWIVNIRRKQFFCCVSNFTFLYLFLVFSCVPFLYQRPRSGFPFLNVEAVLFLTFMYVLQVFPLLVMKDTPKDGFPDYSSHRIRFLCTALIVLTVPSSIYYSFDLMNLLKFVNSEITREIFREDIDRAIMGNPVAMLFAFGMIFSKCSLFMGLYTFLFSKDSKLRSALLIFGGLSPAIRGLSWLARSVLWENAMFILVMLIVFYPCLPPAGRKRIKNVFIALGVASVPFFALSYARFKNDVIYQIFAYFAEGPYFFGILYTAICSCGIPLFNGAMNIPLFCKLFCFFSGGHFEAYDPNWKVEYLYVFLNLADSWSGEFSTIVGGFLLDFGRATVTIAFILLSILFTIFFRNEQSSSISHAFVKCFYAHLIITGTIGFFYAETPGNLELIIMGCFYFVLKKLPFSKMEDNEKTPQ